MEPFVLCKRYVGLIRINKVSNSSKVIVTNIVILWRNITSRQIEYARNGRGMCWRIAKIQTSARSSFPFRQFLAILELGVKYVGWTTPYMHVAEHVIIGKACPSEKLERGDLRVAPGKMIPDVNGVFQSKRPKVGLRFRWPVK